MGGGGGGDAKTPAQLTSPLGCFNQPVILTENPFDTAAIPSEKSIPFLRIEFAKEKKIELFWVKDKTKSLQMHKSGMNTKYAGKIPA